MAFNEIPKIRWRRVEVNGATLIGTDTILSMSSTAELRVGMIVDHADFPVGTKILTILGANSIQLDQNALNSASATRDYYFEFIFRYPPSEDDSEKLKVKERKSVSISGVRQVSIDHIEFSRVLKFSFLTREEVELLRAFWIDWGHTGQAFEYYEDKGSASLIEYESDDLDFEPKKVTPILYELAFKLRRVQ